MQFAKLNALRVGRQSQCNCRVADFLKELQTYSNKNCILQYVKELQETEFMTLNYTMQQNISDISKQAR